MPSSASRPGRRPDPATRQHWQQRLYRFRRSGLTVPGPDPIRIWAGAVRFPPISKTVRAAGDQATC
jgi:hypothetical protein